MNKQIGIAFGLLCLRISEQLKEQGFELTEKDNEKFEHLRESCNMVSIHGLIPESQQKPMYQKLLKQVIESAKPIAEYKI